ncbi:MAG: hypothetical protein WDZ40_04520 [Candidatus Spechtbacterales bacterium]
MNNFSLSLKNFIDACKNILIVAGNDKKIDNLVSSYALALVAKKEGKNVSIYFTGQNLPEQLRFLNIQKFTEGQYKEFPKHDGTVFVGVTNEERYRMFMPEHTTANNVLNIHSGNPPDTASEKLTRALKELDANYITDVVATALLSGIVSSTQNFQNPNVQPQTLFISAYLTSKKAKNELIVQHLYKTKPMETIKLWGSVIANFSYVEDKKIGWSFIEYSDIKKNSFNKSLGASLINELKNNFNQANIIILGIEHAPGKNIALIHALSPDFLKNFSKTRGVALKNSSCIMQLRSGHAIKTATHKAAKEISATL